MIPRSPEQSIPEPQGFSFLEYDKAREKIPEHTRASVDAWREEVLDICRAHGVDHPSKLVTAEAHASAQTLERVQNLLDDILYVFEHQKLPPEKRETEPIDDEEYSISLGRVDWRKMPAFSSDLSVCDQHGRFYLLNNGSNPPCLYDEQGNKQLLPKDYFYGEMIYLGPQPVLLTKRKGEDTGYFLTDLKGERLDPPGTFVGWESSGDHITAIGSTSKKSYFPVAQDGTILEDRELEVKNFIDIESEIVAGHTYFFIREMSRWKIYTAEKIVMGNPDGYEEKPLLCEKDGCLTIVARDEKDSCWWIYDENGFPLKKINTRLEIQRAITVNGHYFFAARKEESPLILETLLNEQGSVRWQDRGGKRIQLLSSKGSTLTFLTHEVFDNAPPGREIEDCYYDQQGKLITCYFTHPQVQCPPLFIGGAHAYAFLRRESGMDQATIRHDSFPNVALGIFKTIYAMEAIDEHRFYVIGLEQAEDGTCQIAKRVYDLRRISKE